MVAEKAEATLDATSALKAEKEAEALESTTTEKAEGLKSGLTDKLKSFGQ